MTSVDPERLLKDLRRLWLDLGKESPDGVLRACAMTLIVVADEKHDAQIIGETIASLIHEHPSRAIVVRVRGCEERVLEARVFAQCWMPFGGRQQICCEQVEIIASPATLADVATVVRALLVPDLPVILYSPSETLWWLPQFGSMLPLAGKVIVDSCGMSEPARVLGFLAELPSQVRQKADLVWSRLTPWRESIAQIFENPKRSRNVYDLTEVRILYKGAEEPSSVYYMAGWFMHVLGAGVPVRIARGVGHEYAGIAHISLSGANLEAEVGMYENRTAEVVINGEAPQVTVFPTANDAWALRQELSIGSNDAVFNDVTGLANLLRGAA
jgi:glucose-6-phosphate dehydrogenase assembly protein OpcA